MYKTEQTNKKVVNNDLNGPVGNDYAKIMLAIKEVVDSGSYIGGEKVKKFEESFADYLGVTNVTGVASGTDALQLALRVCGIKPGDKVATVSHTAVATVAAIELVGAIPVFIDIERDVFTIDSNHLKHIMECYKSNPSETSIKAIVAVHLYGQPANMNEIISIAEQYGVFLIEDCAQAHGAHINDKKCGTWGNISTFSFYPTKNLGCLGDGGAVATNDPILAEKARYMREYGWKERYISEFSGMNTRLDTLHAAVLLTKLSHLDIENKKRRNYAKLYDKYLNFAQIKIPIQRDNYYHVYHQYVIKTKHRDSLHDFLSENGISTAILYPLPVHLQPAYKSRIRVEKRSLKNTEDICKQILCLPIAPWLSTDDISYTIDMITRWCKTN